MARLIKRLQRSDMSVYNVPAVYNGQKMILELSSYEYSGLWNYCELEISNTGCPMISTNLKIRTPVIIEDMADKYGSFFRQYDAVVYHTIFVMLL